MSNDNPGFYTIHIEGLLDDRWAEWFGDMLLRPLPGQPARTEISGYIVDQAALHGILNRIRDLSLRLIAVERTA